MRYLRYLALSAMILIFLVPSMQTFVSGKDDPIITDSTRSIDDIDFESIEVYRETDLVYRSAYGDLIPSREGMEMATCSMNGKVVVTYGSGNSWTSEIAHRSFIGETKSETAQVYSIDAGDLLPEFPGDEIVAVDEDYTVNLIRHDQNQGWISEEIIGWPITDDWLFEVDIGELKENGDQLEIVVVSDSRKAWIISRTDEGWTGELILTDKDALDACWIYDIMPEHPGNEIVFGGGRGVVVVSYYEDEQWKSIDAQLLGEFITDVVVADIDPEIDGGEIYASTTGGDLYAIYRKNGQWVNDTIHSEGRVIYGIETGVVDGRSVISIATYGHRVGLVWKDIGWNFRPIYGELFYVMGTGIFDIDPIHEGQEILSLGYFGKVVVIYRSEPGQRILLPYDNTKVKAGSQISIPVIVLGEGGFQGQVQMSVDANIASSEFSKTVLNADNFTVLNITVPDITGTFDIEISASSIHGLDTAILELEVVDEGGGFHFMDLSNEMEVGLDRQTSQYITIIEKEGQQGSIQLDHSGISQGIQLDLPDLLPIATTSSRGGDITISAGISAQPGRYLFHIIAYDENGWKTAMVTILSIKERSLKDFQLAVDEPYIIVPMGSNESIMVTVISLYGFSSEVSLEIPTIPKGIEMELLQTKVVPTGSVELNISVENASGTFYIPILGRWNDLEHETYFRIDVEPPAPKIIMTIPDGPIFAIENDNGEGEASFSISLSPEGGVIEDLSLSITGLGENISVTVTPANIKRLAYEMEITFRLNGSYEDLMGSITINASSKDPYHFTTGIVSIEVNDTSEDNDVEGNGISTMAIVIIVLSSLFLIVVVGAVFLRANSLNQEERVQRSNEGDKGDHSRNASGKRLYGGIGSSHRGRR